MSATVNISAFGLSLGFKIRPPGLERGINGFYGWMPIDKNGNPICPHCLNRWMTRECNVCGSPYWNRKENQ